MDEVHTGAVSSALGRVLAVSITLVLVAAPWVSFGPMMELNWNGRPWGAFAYAAASVAVVSLLALAAHGVSLRTPARVAGIVTGSYIVVVTAVFTALAALGVDASADYGPPNYTLWALPMSAAASAAGVIIAVVAPRRWPAWQAAVVAGGVVLLSWLGIWIYIHTVATAL